MKVHKAVFIDKDGTLIPDIPFNVDPGLITLSENSVGGLRMLQQQGYKLIVVSNQSGIAHGYFHEGKMYHVIDKLNELLIAYNVTLSGFYFCPHHPEGKINDYTVDCDCRKPQPGMLLKAADDLNIDLERSWMIGDILNDIEAGNRAGCKSILIDNGNETEWLMNDYRTPATSVISINEAAVYITSKVNDVDQLE